MTTTNEKLKSWVAEMARLTSPDRIHWCDGSDQEYENLVEEMVASGTLVKLNQDTHPGCTLHRSDPDDVARVEHLTFICTKHEDDAGPNNNWMAPADAHTKVDALFAGCMKGRTMYVVPYVMGPIASPLSKAGVELTDSAYVAANMRIMTRMGTPAMKRIETDAKDSFVKGLHSIGDLDPERRFIMHFPEERLIKSVGSGYGGNALLGKKCHALRIAKVLDELNDLAELLRCVPELNVLSSCLRARQTGRATTAATGHDRIAAMAREHFGRDLDVIDRAQREKDAVAYDARFGIDPPLYAGELIGAPEAVTDAVRWRLQRLRAVLEMVQ